MTRITRTNVAAMTTAAGATKEATPSASPPSVTTLKAASVTWTLVRKDVRLLLPVFVGAAVLAAVFCVGVPAVAMYEEANRAGYRMTERGLEAVERSPHTAVVFARALMTAATIVLATLVLWSAVVGGMAFAYERRERWADLPGVLPVSRKRLVGIKLATCVLACLAMFVACGLIGPVGYGLAHVAWNGNADWRFETGVDSSDVVGYGRTVVMMTGLSAASFGLAWAVSAAVGSPVIAAGVSIATTLVALVCWMSMPRVFGSDGWPVHDGWRVADHGLPWAAGAVTILVGTVWAIRRAEP